MIVARLTNAVLRPSRGPCMTASGHVRGCRGRRSTETTQRLTGGRRGPRQFGGHRAVARRPHADQCRAAAKPRSVHDRIRSRSRMSRPPEHRNDAAAGELTAELQGDQGRRARPCGDLLGRCTRAATSNPARTHPRREYWKEGAAAIPVYFTCWRAHRGAARRSRPTSPTVWGSSRTVHEGRYIKPRWCRRCRRCRRRAGLWGSGGSGGTGGQGGVGGRQVRRRRHGGVSAGAGGGGGWHPGGVGGAGGAGGAPDCGAAEGPAAPAGKGGSVAGLASAASGDAAATGGRRAGGNGGDGDGLSAVRPAAKAGAGGHGGQGGKGGPEQHRASQRRQR